MAKATNGSGITVKPVTGGFEIDGGNGVDVITADTYFSGNDPLKTYTIVAGNGDDTVWGSARNEIIWGDSLGNSGTNSDNGADQLHGAAALTRFMAAMATTSSGAITAMTSYLATMAPTSSQAGWAATC